MDVEWLVTLLLLLKSFSYDLKPDLIQCLVTASFIKLVYRLFTQQDFKDFIGSLICDKNPRHRGCCGYILTPRNQ